MLGTVLDRLTGLLSKSFIVAAFFPALTFSALNGFILYWNCSWFQSICKHFFSLGAVQQSYLLGTVLTGVVLIAYLLSSVSLFLRELLEGKHLPDWPWVRKIFVAHQSDLLNRIQIQMEHITRGGTLLKERIDTWKKALSEARKTGKNKDDPLSLQKGQRELDDLDELFKARAEIDEEDLKAPVEAVRAALEQNDLANPGVDDLQVKLSRFFEEALRRKRVEYNRLAAVRQFSFDRERIAATMLGNIAQTAPSYAAQLYGMNLDALFTRLQKVLQDNDKFYQVMLDAKTQLDFLVNFWWLTVGTTAVWLVALLATSETVFWFVAIGALGPLLAWLWYHLAAEAYRLFSDVLRSAVDLYRFDLLKALHLPLPATLWEERDLWEYLNRMSWGNSSVPLRFKHPEATSR